MVTRHAREQAMTRMRHLPTCEIERLLERADNAPSDVGVILYEDATYIYVAIRRRSERLRNTIVTTTVVAMPISRSRDPKHYDVKELVYLR